MESQMENPLSIGQAHGSFDQHPAGLETECIGACISQQDEVIEHSKQKIELKGLKSCRKYRTPPP